LSPFSLYSYWVIMAESTNWKILYQSLREFISAYPEIVIKINEVSIPQDLRDEFYRRFDTIRRAMVEDGYSALPPEIGALSENYIQIEKEITTLLGLDRIIMPLDLSIFLHNPKEGLIRLLYNRTFDLLQGKITEDVFARLAESDLQIGARDLFRLGYEWWAGLAFIRLLDPDGAFLVDLDEDYKPVLREMKDISFGRQAHHPTMRIPEFVLHSCKVDKYVAVKMALAREIETFVVPFKPPVRPKKKTGDTSFALDSRVMLLSFMSSTEEIPVYADIYECTLTSPHWMVEFISGNELDDPNALEQVRRHFESLNPKLGTCLILINPEHDAKPDGMPESVRAVAAGFDRSKLQSVIDAVAKEV
jgi:hypothetical protein